MRTEHTKPPWKNFGPSVMGPTLITLPTSRSCPNKGPGCLIAKAHGLLNDTEACLREGLKDVEPNSDQEMADLELITALADLLQKAEHRMRNVLLRNGTNCQDAERCRCL